MTVTETFASRPQRNLESGFMTWQDRVDAALESVFVEFANEPFIDQVTQAPDLDTALKAAVRRVAEQRRVAVRQLAAGGWSLTDIAHETGLSVNRIKQIETGKGKP